MAPVALKAHTCQHCQLFVLSSEIPSRWKADHLPIDLVRTKHYFELTLANIQHFAEEGCAFFQWLRDDEWIHKSDIDVHIRKLRGFKLDFDTSLPSPDPQRNLSTLVANYPGQLDSFKLVACFDQSWNRPLELIKISGIGLLDSCQNSLVARSRNSLNVFAEPENPAADIVSTRPIERNPASNIIFSQLSFWLHECLKSQSPHDVKHVNCRKPSKDFMPARLLEIQEHDSEWKLCLREMHVKSSNSYAALSYCWGLDQPIKTTKDRKASWSLCIPPEILPKTIRDAVTVCRKLGIQFLWVDAFCIVQDDPWDKEIQISSMPRIYQNAAFTIVASRASSVEEGFLGPREFPGQLFRLPYRCRDLPNGEVILTRVEGPNEPLDSRGWTLQERLLSPRIIEFRRLQTRGFCEADQNGIRDGWRISPEKNAGCPDLLKHQSDRLKSLYYQTKGLQVAAETWHDIVSSYTSRRLTDPTDRLAAIAGMAERYAHASGDEYCAGLWKSKLLRGLMWRNFGVDNIQTRPERYQGPSWSWTGVNGRVRFADKPVSDNAQAHVFQCDIETANAEYLYGSVREGCAKLVIKGRMLRAFPRLGPTLPHWWRDGVPQGQCYFVDFVPQNDDQRLRELAITHDTIESGSYLGGCPKCSKHHPCPNDVQLFEVFSGRAKTSYWGPGNYWGCSGLVLRQVGDDRGQKTFMREGSFEFGQELADEPQKESVPQEVVDRRYDWWKNCTRELITII